MNTVRSTPTESDPFRALKILDELSQNDSLTQRDLSSRLSIALGLVNSYLKNLIAKGYVTVKSIPPKRYAYYLTPKGFAEKTRLTYHLMQDYTRIYREARANFKNGFYRLEDEGIQKIVFAGADETAEIAYLTLQETGLKFVGILDDEKSGEPFFGQDIQPIRNASALEWDAVVITSYLKRKSIYQELLKAKLDKKRIHAVFAA